MLDKYPDLISACILIFFGMITFISVANLKYSIKKTLLISVPFTIILLAFACFLYKNTELKTFKILSDFVFFVPEMILAGFLGKRRGVSLIVAFLSAYIPFFMIILLKNVAETYSWYQHLELIIYVLFIPFTTLYLNKFYNPFHNEVEKLLPKFLLLLGLYSIFILFEFYAYRYLITTTTARILRLEIFGIAIISVYIISLSFFSLLLKSYRKTYIKANKKAIVDKQLEAVLDQYNIIETREKELTIMRHDMKHLLITVTTLIQQKKYSDAIKLLNDQSNSIDAKRIIKYCHDPLINAIITYYKNLCKQKAIPLKIKVKNIDKALKLKSSELAILISNCFDNAINASDKLLKDREIDFKFINNNDALVLQIKNRFDGIITYDKNNVPTNLKENHGIGTQSIISFCKSNKLTLDYDITENYFTLSILF